MQRRRRLSAPPTISRRRGRPHESTAKSRPKFPFIYHSPSLAIVGIRQTEAILLIMIILIGLVAVAWITENSSASSSSGSSEVASSPSACASGNALTQITESAAGVLSLICSAFVSSLAQGAHTVTGAIIHPNSTSIGWNVFGQNFQAKLLTQSCPANQFVKTVADTVVCDVLVNSANAL